MGNLGIFFILAECHAVVLTLRSKSDRRSECAVYKRLTKYEMGCGENVRNLNIRVADGLKCEIFFVQRYHAGFIDLIQIGFIVVMANLRLIRLQNLNI